jgi:hypothetical protein
MTGAYNNKWTGLRLGSTSNDTTPKRYPLAISLPHGIGLNDVETLPANGSQVGNISFNIRLWCDGTKAPLISSDLSC